VSKIVKTVLIVAAAVAIVVFAPQIGAFLATAAASAGVTVAAAGISSALVGIGISMALAAASSLLLPVPKPSQSLADRLNLNIDPTAPRKIIFGRTAAGSDVRFKETWGKDKDRLSFVVANASHKITKLNSAYLNNELSHNGANVTGKYASGIVELSTCLEGTPNNGRAVGSGAYWTAASTFVGCAYSVVTFRTDKAKVFPDGLPSRVTTVVDGCPVYDPRRDSTRGGSGPMRVHDQPTWAFTAGGVDIGRNPALALITYLVGYRINSKLAWGWGLPPEKIDFASFIKYANLCEEPVTLKAGGTAQKYLIDGIFSTADSHESVVNAICACMGSTVLVDTGGVFNLIGGFDDTLSVPFAFGEDDLIGTDNWNPSPPSRERYNIVKGRFADPSTLYTLADWGRIEVDPMFDDIPRTTSIDYGLISNAEACQRISKQRLYAEKWGGIFTGVFGPRAFAVQVGDVVTLSHPRHGWNNKRFRVISQSESHDLIFQMSLREDDSEIYAWDSQEYTPPPANLLNEEYDPALAEVVTGLSLSTLTQEGANAVTTSFVQVTWTPSTSARVSEVEIATKLATSEVWTEQGGKIENTGTYLFSTEVGGAAINVRARYVMDNGVRGPWSNSNVTTSTNNLNSWSGVYGEGKPADHATYGAPGDSPVGDSTANQVIQRIDAAHETIDELEALIGNIPDGSTVAQEITRVAAAEVGGNLLPNSDFAAGTAGWGLVTNTPQEFYFATDNAEFTVTGEHYAGLLCLQRNGDLGAAVVSDWVAVTPGSWVQISAWLASRECTATLRLQWGNGSGGYMSDAADSPTISGPRGWENLDGWQRVWTKAQAPEGARFARLVLVKGQYLANPQGDLSWAMMLRPMLALATADQTVPTNYRPTGGGAGLARASARIEEVSTAAASDTAAVASRTTNLEADYNGLSGRVSTTEGAVSTLNGKVGAYWKTTATSPQNRAQLTIYAEANGGAGVDIVGDVTISGDLAVDGTIRTSKLDGNAAQSVQFARTSSQQLLTYGQSTRIIQLTFQKFVQESSIDLYANIRMKSGDDIVGSFRIINLNNGAVEDTFPIWMVGANDNFQVPIALNWIATGWTPGIYTLAIDYISQESDASTWAEAGSIIKIHEIKR